MFSETIKFFVCHGRKILVDCFLTRFSFMAWTFILVVYLWARVDVRLLL